jgi:hypothetical protein
MNVDQRRISKEKHRTIRGLFVHEKGRMERLPADFLTLSLFDTPYLTPVS